MTVNVVVKHGQTRIHEINDQIEDKNSRRNSIPSNSTINLDDSKLAKSTVCFELSIDSQWSTIVSRKDSSRRRLDEFRRTNYRI